MKHLKKGRKLSRLKKQREALLKTMLGSLIKKGKIETTEAKAKELKKLAEKVVNRIKKSSKEGKIDVSALRQVKRHVPKHIDVKEFSEIAKSFASRNGGYIRIIKKGVRLSDSAKIAIIEFVK